MMVAAADRAQLRARRSVAEFAPGLAGALTALAVVTGLVSLAAAHGGYFPTSWGWTTLVLLWAAVLGLLLGRRIVLSRAETVLLLAAGALVFWTGLSILWSDARVESVDELERALVYGSGLLAVLVLVRAASVSNLLAGVLGATTLIAAYALGTRLLPDRVGTFDSTGVYRLSEPVGYWNALGIFAAMGALLAVGFAARARRLAGRAAAAASVPVLLLTLYFTFGRGAWIAFAVGLCVVIAADPRRLQLLASLALLAAPSGIVVWLASRSKALTTEGSSLARASHDGHLVALALLAAVVVGAVLAAGLASVESRISPGRMLRAGLVVLLVVVTVGASSAVFARYGGPVTLARKAYDSFTSPPFKGASLNGRVLNLSSNGRTALWSVAWRDFEQHPLLGSGAGSYEQYWRAHRSSTLDVRDAHNLYLETLAELGVVGLGLLVAMLGIPFLALRHRRTHLVPFAVGAYAAFLLHAGADWDWEMPAVTLAALGCGAAALVATRECTSRSLHLPDWARYAAVALVLVAGVFSVDTLLGNRDTSASSAAAARHEWSKAAADARSARRWLPWSSDPWRLLGDAQFGRGDFPAAARSYRKAISLDPRNWELWFDLGFATSGGRSDAAFARAAALDPRNPDIPKEPARAS